MLPHGVWAYTACRHFYGGATQDELHTHATEIVVHRSSMAIAPNCLHAAEVAAVSAGDHVAVPPFDSCGLSFVEPAEHTMAYALPHYCLNKVPKDTIHRAVQMDRQVCVWGIFDGHVVEYAFERGYAATRIDVHEKAKVDAVLNRERPRLYFLQSLASLVQPVRTASVASSATASPAASSPHSAAQTLPPGLLGDSDAACGFYVLAVFPGSDYVYHYARLVRQALELMKRGSSSTLLEIRRFPLVENRMAQWTALGDVPVESGDVVVLGHVRDYYARLLQCDATWTTAGAVPRARTGARAGVGGAVDGRGPAGEGEHKDVAADEAGDDGHASAASSAWSRNRMQDWASNVARGRARVPAALMSWWPLFAAEPKPEDTWFVPPMASSWQAVCRTPPPTSSGSGGGGGSTTAAMDMLLNEQQQRLQAAVAAALPLLAIAGGTPPSAVPSLPSELLALSASLSIAVPGTTTIPWCNYAWEVLPLRHAEHTLPDDDRQVAPKRVLFLGVRYSYWGNAVYPIVKAAFARTQYVIYAGKCGTLAAGSQGIHKIVAPHQYSIVRESAVERSCTMQHVFKYGRSFLHEDFESLAPARRRGLVLKAGDGDGSDAAAVARFQGNGLHVSVPTVVGETYVQRDLMDAGGPELTQQRVLYSQLRKAMEGGLLPSVDKATVTRALNAVFFTNKPPQEVHLAALELVVKHFASPADVLARWRPQLSATPPNVLLSIDNETSWIALAANEVITGSKGSHGRMPYFTAIHRTTDYVRKREDSSAITGDDLAAEKGHSSKRRVMLDAIGNVLYRMLRRFVKYSPEIVDAEAAVAAAAEDWFAQRAIAAGQPRSPAPQSGKLHWGILSTAQISSRFVGALRTSVRSKLVAVASRSLEKASEHVASKLGGDVSVRPWGSYEALLADRNVTAVYIPLPNDMHVEWALRAVAAGKHVLIEKPLALAASDVDRLRVAAEAAGVHVAEAMLPLSHPMLQRLIAELPVIGTVTSAAIQYHHPLPRTTIAYRSLEHGGGAMRALGCYNIAVLQALFGPITLASAMSCWYAEPCEDAGHHPCDVSSFVTGTCQGDQPVFVSMSCSIASKKCQRLVIVGTDGRIDVAVPFRPGTDGPAAFTIALSGGLGHSYTVEAENTEAFAAQLSRFEDAVFCGPAPLSSLLDTAAAVATAEAALQLAKSLV